MKITWQPRDVTGRCGFRAVPDAYDGIPPIDTALMDGSGPLLTSPDRTAVAAALLFGPWIGGALELDTACSPATAAAISRFLARAVLVTPQVLDPHALPIGAGLALVAQGHDRSVEPVNAFGERRQFLVQCLRSDKFAGSLAGIESLRIATNVDILHAQQPTALARRLGSVALAVIFAQSALIDELAVPDLSSDPQRAERLADLLQSVRLGLTSLELAAS